MARLLALLGVLSLAVAACSGGSGGASSAPTTHATPSTPTTAAPVASTLAPDLAAAHVKLTPVAAVSGALAMATRPGDPNIYVATQTGKVVAVHDGAVRATPILDLDGKVLAGGEQGLLGMTFSPDGSHLDVHYSGLQGQTIVEEYAVTRAATGVAVVDTGSARTLLTLPQPQPNHNGGQLAYGPDDHLYIGLGDGGNADDVGPGHAPQGNGQDPSTFLGKIDRIDPSTGRTVVCDSGLRNPWRFSFDPANGDLWIGDVGQNAWEEIDHLAHGTVCGANFGWPILEGTHPERASTAPGTIAPVFEISHAHGDCAVVGGYVYRGTKIPNLTGSYLFSDNCNGHIRALRLGPSGNVGLERDLGVEGSQVSSFGQDGDGELYVLSLDHGLSRFDPA